mmetsp:Transcript_6513/g.15751  ORF Transcript_6513/g.15751 Transcript_6513/m.15751 type:complete len:206 (-) Transcript_6513:121-738(-)
MTAGSPSAANKPAVRASDARNRPPAYNRDSVTLRVKKPSSEARTGSGRGWRRAKYGPTAPNPRAKLAATNGAVGRGWRIAPGSRSARLTPGRMPRELKMKKKSGLSALGSANAFMISWLSRESGDMESKLPGLSSTTYATTSSHVSAIAARTGRRSSAPAGSSEDIEGAEVRGRQGRGRGGRYIRCVCQGKRSSHAAARAETAFV